ncbi:MAG: alpha-L-rhamnosidase [Odoribacteraceae bacterium]|jgi:hypothetical protein|nr:alpha-L-rhamnosidase [Odoribacteraceae bacterium]
MKRTCLTFPLLLLSLYLPGQLPPVFSARAGETARVDPLTRVYLLPTRVAWTSSEERVRNPGVLLTPGEGQAEMTPGVAYCTLSSSETEKASILLDYGRELHGGLRLVTGFGSDRRPSLVRVRFGESIGEANSQTLNSEWKVGFSTDDHAKRDVVIEIPRDGSIEIGNTGFRFVRIDLLESDRTIAIKEARAIFRYRELPYLGSFACSDERLNAIWMTAAYTVHLNMQEFLWDGVKRDRCVWVGDMHPEVMTISAVFGYHDIVPRSLDLVVAQYPLPAWLNRMSAYSLWYLIIHKAWRDHHGDERFLRSHADYIAGLVEIVAGKIKAGDDEGFGRKFLDWPSSPNTPGVEAGYHALLAWAMRDAAVLCNALDRPDLAARCEEAVSLLKQRVKDPNGLKQAAALMAIAGLMDAGKACEEYIAAGGADRFSTFYGYYMLEAMALAGRHQEALDIIRAYWGGMLDMGATTFWENFNIAWMENATRLDEWPVEGKRDIHGDFGEYCYPGYRHSLCHGWASGPAAWLSARVLGVTILEPGCKRVRVSPHLGDLEWAEGAFPTPLGLIKISHEKRPDGSVETRVNAPEGIIVES